MSKKNTTVPGRVAGFLGENSYIIVFVAIFIVYALTTNGLTWSGMMNVFRHSAVIGIIGLGMGLICITGENEDLCWLWMVDFLSLSLT